MFRTGVVREGEALAEKPWRRISRRPQPRRVRVTAETLGQAVISCTPASRPRLPSIGTATAVTRSGLPARVAQENDDPDAAFRQQMNQYVSVREDSEVCG